MSIMMPYKPITSWRKNRSGLGGETDDVNSINRLLAEQTSALKDEQRRLEQARLRTLIVSSTLILGAGVLAVYATPSNPSSTANEILLPIVASLSLNFFSSITKNTKLWRAMASPAALLNISVIVSMVILIDRREAFSLVPDDPGRSLYETVLLLVFLVCSYYVSNVWGEVFSEDGRGEAARRVESLEKLIRHASQTLEFGVVGRMGRVELDIRIANAEAAIVSARTKLRLPTNDGLEKRAKFPVRKTKTTVASSSSLGS